MLIKAYDATVKEYSSNEFDNPAMEKHYKKFLSLIPKNSKILDVGCGPGQAAKRFANKGHDVLGIDLSKNMINSAKKKVKNAKFKIMDVEKLNLNEKYDAIWAAFVLVHIERKKHAKIIAKFSKMLKPKGVIFLGMLVGKGEKIMPEPNNRKYNQYFVFVSKKEVKKYLNLTGFKLVSYDEKRLNEGGVIFKWSYIHARKN